MTARAHLDRRPANGLGIVTFDGEQGRLDRASLSRTTRCRTRCFSNKGNGTFEESAVPAGVGFGENGEVEAGMGVDASDFDGDELPDLYITHPQDFGTESPVPEHTGRVVRGPDGAVRFGTPGVSSQRFRCQVRRLR